MPIEGQSKERLIKEKVTKKKINKETPPPMVYVADGDARAYAGGGNEK